MAPDLEDPRGVADISAEAAAATLADLSSASASASTPASAAAGLDAGTGGMEMEMGMHCSEPPPGVIDVAPEADGVAFTWSGQTSVGTARRAPGKAASGSFVLR